MATALNVSAWSTTAASNDGADSTIGTVANTSSPTSVDDWVKGVMAAVKKYVLDTDGGITSGGTADVLTITTNRSISSGHQAAGFSVRFKAANTNTGAATVNVDTLGAVAIKRLNGDALAAGDIVSGGIYDIAFDGTNYKLMGGGGTAGTYGSLSGDNTWSGANTFTSSVTVGDGSGDVVVIKGTTVHATMSALLSNSTVAALCSAIGLGTEDSPTFTAVNSGDFTSTGGCDITGFSEFARNGSNSASNTTMRISRTDIVNNSPTSAEFVDFFNASTQLGSITLASSTSIAFNTTSDGRRKPEEYRRPLSDSGQIVDALNPIRFRWDSGDDDFGFIAQEVHAVVPQVVKVGDADASKRPGDEGYDGWEMQKGAMEAIIVAELKSIRSRLSAAGL